MDKIEKIADDIRTLRESIKLDNEDIKNLHISGDRLNGILEHIGWCLTELNQLKSRLGKAKNNA